MSEHVTAAECREACMSATDVERAVVLHRAAATIEALQAQIDAKPPASADTDTVRMHAETLRGTRADRLLHRLADVLDASRAECERLRLEAGYCPRCGHKSLGPDDEGGLRCFYRPDVSHNSCSWRQRGDGQ